MADLSDQEKRLLAKYPLMFTHPDIREGEIWYGNHVSEIAVSVLCGLNEHGVTARIGDRTFPTKVVNNGQEVIWPCYPVFVNREQYLKVEATLPEEQPA